MEFTKSFEPAEIEKFWRIEWEKRGYFTPSISPEKQTFSVQLPPPNVTGTLHMGHAFNQTIIDCLTRYHRMCGFNTVWIPGTDHAGIATQIAVERHLDAQKISRHNLGRTKFIDTVWEWKKKFGTNITNQMRYMGVSTDWNREYFTMDTNISKVVTEIFVRLYKQGLIYRGKRLVNWDPVLCTAVSDLEVISQEEDGFMWYIRYLLTDGSGYIIVATTRPETLLGDVAVAINSNDKRYTHLIGKTLKLPLIGREIPIIMDNFIDKTFGTGCVKITPAHDFNDYAVSERHNLNKINIFTLDAKININGPLQYQGLDRFDARKKIVADLTAQGLLETITSHKLSIPRGDRTGVILEPMLTDQWFMAMNKPTVINNEFNIYFPGKSIAQVALEKIANGEIKFIPENWNHTYNQWLNNIQDWCISRQLWWGHQIPAWYDEDGKIYVAHNEKEAKLQANNKKITRDNDVLDTWFSSATIPFATLGWPEKTIDYELFLPSSVLVTGFDIIFFWVARMIMITTHFTGKIPFKTVYIHGLVRDTNCKKMSKSKGNTIDPIDLIKGIDINTLVAKRSTDLINLKQKVNIENVTRKEFINGIPEFGTDALRFTFASLATFGRNINFDLNRCQGYKNFCNKLWNATRFVLMNTRDYNYDFKCYKNYYNEKKLQFSNADLWIMSKLYRTEKKVKQGFTDYRFDYIASALYKFIWDEYCDWYLEITKIHFKHGNIVQKRAARYTLLYVLERVLRLAHPIIPFITEALWQAIIPIINTKLKIINCSIMQQSFPTPEEETLNKTSELWMKQLKILVETCRNLRSKMQLPHALFVPLIIETTDLDKIQSFVFYLQVFGKLTNIKITKQLPQSLAPVAIIGDLKLMLNIKIDIAAERERLIKEINYINDNIIKINNKLKIKDFILRAPIDIVNQERNKLIQYNTIFLKLQEQLRKLK